MSNETTTFRLAHVEIERGRDVLTVSVPEHEVLVLEAVHGTANVRVVDGDEDEIELSVNADHEFARLQNRYRRVNAPDMVRAAFPEGPRGLERHGFQLGRGGVQAAPQSAVRNHKQEAKAKAGAKPAKGKSAD